MKKIATIALIAVLAGLASGFAQTSGQLAGEELLRALLLEMRALRTTIQRNSSFELRGQLLLERARQQQQLVRDMQREVEQRGQITGIEDEGMATYATELEERIRAEANPDTRRQLERERDQMKRRMEMQKVHMERERVRWQRQEQQLVEEKQKLQAIEEELGELAREMVR
jgi:hypothetical protein